MPSRQTRSLIVLSCLHTIIFDPPLPKRGELVYCRRCEDYRGAATLPESYRIECRDCFNPVSKGSRTEFGGNTLAAEIAADKHARRKPGHRVRVLNGDALVSERMHEPLDFSLDEIPF